MSIEVELWMHPTCLAAATALRANPGSAEAEAVTRTMALLDAAVAALRASGHIASTLVSLKPRCLTIFELLGSSLTSWPATTEGLAIQQSCVSATLCLYQVGRVRSVVGIVDCGAEMFVVWLSARPTAPTRSDGFEDDTDAALAQRQLWDKLGLLIDLTWLESA